MTNVNGPRYDPCGIPPVICSQSEVMSSICTRWRRCHRKKHIHRMMMSGTSRACIFITKILWSTWSNAFAKSMNTVRTDWPLSMALCQWCIMSTNACVVDRPLRAPYWRASSLLLTRSRIHCPMKDSNSFANVATNSLIYGSYNCTSVTLLVTKQFMATVHSPVYSYNYLL